MKQRLFLPVIFMVFGCLATSCATKPPCLIAPPQNYHGNIEDAKKLAGDLTKITVMPIDVTLESTFKNAIDVSYQAVPDKDVRCQMFLQTIICLSDRKDASADHMVIRLIESMGNQGVCVKEQLEPLKMKFQPAMYTSEKPVLGKEKIGPFEVNAQRNVARNAEEGVKNGLKVDLPAGTWSIIPKGGGWSAWPTVGAAKLVGKKTPWAWLVNITANGTTECYGECDNWWQFSNQKEAESYALQKLAPYSLFLERPTQVYFWLPDSDTDNQKGVILEIRKACTEIVFT